MGSVKSYAKEIKSFNNDPMKYINSYNSLPKLPKIKFYSLEIFQNSKIFYTNSFDYIVFVKNKKYKINRNYIDKINVMFNYIISYQIMKKEIFFQ